MSARSGLVGKKSSRPYLGPSEAIFSIGQKNPKNAKILPIFLGGPMGPIHAVLGHVLMSLVSKGTESLRAGCRKSDDLCGKSSNDNLVQQNGSKSSTCSEIR